jgi:hypothetical protein
MPHIVVKQLINFWFILYFLRCYQMRLYLISNTFCFACSSSIIPNNCYCALAQPKLTTPNAAPPPPLLRENPLAFTLSSFNRIPHFHQSRHSDSLFLFLFFFYLLVVEQLLVLLFWFLTPVAVEPVVLVVPPFYVSLILQNI